MIEVKGVHLRAGKLPLLADFSWCLPDSGAYLLLGPTGAGKSLLARLLTGRQRPRRGQVLIDGTPLYSLFGRYGEPLFLAQAEAGLRSTEPLDLYLAAELAAVGESPSVLEGVWPDLEDLLPHGRRTSINRLSHGQLLLAQVALACAMPVRLAVLDGHLTAMDYRYCARAASMLSGIGSVRDKFVLLTASRLACSFPAAHSRYLLSGSLPVTITELAADAAVDTAVEPVNGTGALRVYAPAGPQGWSGITSGRHFGLLSHLEDGLRIRLTGSLDAALSELRSLGVRVLRIEWEDRPR